VIRNQEDPMATRIAAHPLVVAAAFGLLGPAAMADDLEDTEFLIVDGAESSSLADAPKDVVIDAAEFARVEAEWFAVRGLKVD
jgi:hypothetical protein